MLVFLIVRRVVSKEVTRYAVNYQDPNVDEKYTNDPLIGEMNESGKEPSDDDSVSFILIMR